MSKLDSGSNYPSDAQVCYHSLRRGGDGIGSEGLGGIVICPEGYNYCQKDVMDDVSQAECGNYPFTKNYFGDTWDENQMACTYRKCARECVEGSVCFGPDCPDPNAEEGSGSVGGEAQRQREIYCCDAKPGWRGEPCNSVGRVTVGGMPLAFLALVIVLMAIR